MVSIKKILRDNIYFEDVIKQHTLQTTARFTTLKPFGPDKCPVYLKVSWIREPFTKLNSGVKAAVDNCFPSFNS